MPTLPNYNDFEVACKTNSHKGYSLKRADLLLIKNTTGQTGLHLLAEYGHVEDLTAEDLTYVDKITKEIITDDVCETPLHVAARRGVLNKISGGVTADQLYSTIDNIPNRTALEVAADYGNLNQIKGGANADVLASLIYSDETTALHHAARHKNIGKISGATAAKLASVKDCQGNTPLHVAAEYGTLNSIIDCVSADKLLSTKNNWGLTALEVAAKNGHLGHEKGSFTIKALAATKSGKFEDSALWHLIVASLFDKLITTHKGDNFWLQLTSDDKEVLERIFKELPDFVSQKWSDKLAWVSNLQNPGNWGKM